MHALCAIMRRVRYALRVLDGVGIMYIDSTHVVTRAVLEQFLLILKTDLFLQHQHPIPPSETRP